jgi:SAM-dependent methyltransferase
VTDLVFEYKGRLYPDLVKRGNGCQYIAPIARQFCKGFGIDVGCGKWPLEGAMPVDLTNGGDAMALPVGEFDFVFSSHCLEHLPDPIGALEHWRTRIKPHGVLFLYLPHPDMEYWLPQNCRKHLHSWMPPQIIRMLADLGFYNVLGSQRDMAFGFATVGFKRG